VNIIVGRLKPLNDFIFGKTFGEKGDEEQLLSLLNAILAKTKRKKLVEIEIVEHKTFTAEIIGDKTSILDIRAVAADCTRINIEVQLQDYGNMDKRSLFYWSREFANGLSRSEDYNLLPNVIAINIVNFEVAKIDDFHATFHLWEDTRKDYLLTDALEIHFIDVKKFNALPEKDIVNNPLHRWLTFFDQNISDDLLKELIGMDTAISKANEKMTFLSNDKEMLRLYNMREMAQIDYNSGMLKARAEGKTEGRCERDIEIARNMVLDEEPVDKIIRYTSLTVEEIEKLR
jgi:predicted transposase/invertase (TIGR01784 family)